MNAIIPSIHGLASRHIGMVLMAGVAVVAAIPTNREAAAAESPKARAAAVRTLVDRQLEKPSIHDERTAIDDALAAAGVPEETVIAFHHAVSQAILPGMAPSTDAFLFMTRDPQWLAFRKHFSEFLELPDMVVIDAPMMRALADYDGVVTLPAVTELSPKAAAACRHFGAGAWGAAIEFPGVSEISPGAAAALVRCEALLVFPHLRQLSVETATALAKHQGLGLVLGGLTTLPPEVAAALAEVESERGLLLPDLVVLDSVPLAKRLARQDHVFLPAVRRVPPEIAEALRGNEGGELALPEMEEIPPAVAKQLVGAGYYGLVLGGAARLSPEAAEILAEHQGTLAFPGSEPFSAAAATKLAAHAHGIFLPHIASLPAEVARALAQHEGPLVLGSVSALSTDDAAALAKHEGPVYLLALERLTPEIAAILAPRIPHIFLPRLDTVDAETAAALAANADGALTLNALTTISPSGASALAAFKGTLSLAGITTLTAETARALAAHRGALVLSSLEDLSPDVATELAKHEGPLSLSGITTLSAEAGKALAATRGTLDLSGVFDIAPEAASALLVRTEPLTLADLVNTERLDSPTLAELIVKHCDDISLSSVTSLTGPGAAEVARVLVKTRGTLALPSLERISPRALETLLAKPGIDLPDLDDLQVVPETGHLGNDDYVDPRR